MPNMLYTIDSAALMICMVVMFVELFLVHRQYHEQIAKAKESSSTTIKGLLFVLALVILAQVLFSFLDLPLHPIYLIMNVTPLLVFRFGMYEEGVYRFGHLYTWKTIESCQILEVGEIIKIQFFPVGGHDFTLEFDGGYQNFILNTLSSHDLMGKKEE